MSLPHRYGKRLKEELGVKAVWIPGKKFDLGAILGRKDGQFFQKGHLSEHQAPPMQVATHLDKSLDFSSSGVNTTIFQAGVELPDTTDLDLAADASVKINFSREFSYMLKTPTLRGSHITNLNAIAQAVHTRDDWDHGRFWVVHELFEAAEFSFLGTEQKNQAIELSGKGSGILSFLTAGASVGLTRKGQVTVNLVGAGGPVGMSLVRFEEDGGLDFET